MLYIIEKLIDFVQYLIDIITAPFKIIKSFLTSKAFYTWAFVTYMIVQGWITIDGQWYIIFTCAVMGLKIYKKVKEINNA